MARLDWDRSAARRATNLSINADLLRVARHLKLNLSRELETRLEQVIAEARRARWLADNAEAIEAYNAHIEKSGVWSDGLRRF